MKSVRNRINKGFTETGLKIPKSENRKNPCFWEEKLSFWERTLCFWEIYFSFLENVFLLFGKKKFLFFCNKKCECNFVTYEIFRNRTRHFWINYQKGKGSEEFQKYMEDLTDMQNHVLPYLQSFCNLEEKGVKERREQQIAERYEGRADERVTSTEANEVVKDVGKTDRKPAQQKQAVDGKDKKLSIHERLEINKRIIQEKQGKDKTERGVDLGVRTV